MRLYGLIGRHLSHSFSQRHFTEKFAGEGLKDVDYRLFEIKEIQLFPEIIKLFPKLRGLNITIPYKTAVIPYLQLLDEKARRIGAVNTVEFLPDGKLKGWNTDYTGFRSSLLPLLNAGDRKALVFGSGGASKAVQTVLSDLDIEFQIVSRSGPLRYQDLDEDLLREHPVLINCTPLGMYPDTKSCVAIPYHALNRKHLLFDLVYNPEETLFLQKGREQGARIKNGLEMLRLQAEAAWEIWNKPEDH